MTTSPSRDAVNVSGQDSPGAIAYLVGRYPMLSMIFILREVRRLRERGFRINVASINNPDRPLDALTASEYEEAQVTYYLKAHGVQGALKAHLRVGAMAFRGYCRGLWLAFQLGRGSLTRTALNLAYFTEALMVGVWMNRANQRHLHVHLGSQAATVGLFVHHVFGFGFSITVHGPDEFYDVRGFYLSEKIAAADFIFCVSHYARSQLMLLAPPSDWKKLLVSRLGVNTQQFTPVEKIDSSEPFEVLCIGRLIPAKGQHLLIDAIERLAAQGRSLRLKLVGEGSGGPSLRARAAQLADPSLVVFEGGINQDHLRDYYASADLFCLPSFAEGLPVVLMEAMAMGIACVSTQITGIPELISNGTDGILVAPSDVDGLVSAIGALMDDPGFRKKLGKAGRAKVVEDYDLERNVARLASLFRQRLQGASAPENSACSVYGAPCQ